MLPVFTSAQGHSFWRQTHSFQWYSKTYFICLYTHLICFLDRCTICHMCSGKKQVVKQPRALVFSKINRMITVCFNTADFINKITTMGIFVSTKHFQQNKSGFIWAIVLPISSQNTKRENTSEHRTWSVFTFHLPQKKTSMVLMYIIHYESLVADFHTQYHI